MIIRKILFVIVLATVLVPFTGTAQTTVNKLTLEWIFGDEGRSVAAVPSTFWLSDGKLMIYDTRTPQTDRSFEILDPASGSRRTAVKLSVALDNLNTLLPQSEAPKSLGWPIEFDSSGRKAIYIFNGHLFLLNLERGKFTRLTKTETEEQSPGFSPDGKRLAFVRANDLYVIDLDTLAETRVTRDGSDTILNGRLSWLYWEEIFGRRDIGYWWSPDSKALAYLQTDESNIPISTFVDFQPLTPRVITQHYPKAGMPNPRARVGIAEIGDNSPPTWVQVNDKPYDTIIRVKWLPDSRRVSLQTMTRDQRELGLYFADRETGEAKRILTETDPAWVNIHDDLYFLSEGHFLWASERDDYYHIYRYTMDGRLVNQVTRGKWALASSGGVFWVRQSVAGIDEKQGLVYFTAMEHSPLERHLYRIKMDGSGMTRLSQEAGVHRISMSPNARVYVDNFSDDHTMPALTLYTDEGSRLSRLAEPRMNLLAAFDMQYPEMLTIPTSDDFPMPAQVLKPKGFRADHRYPVIMRVYGGPSAPEVSNSWQFDLFYNQLLANEGFIVIKVDNRTATALNKRLEDSVVGKLGETETADLVDAVHWLKRQLWVDGDRIGVWGWSNGGYITLNLMTRSNEFKAGIAVAPVTDWRFYDSKWAEAFLQNPAENAAGYDRASVVKIADKLHGRLLMIYGSYDDNVHPQNEEAFADALVKSGKLFDLMVYPMRKHGIDDRAATIHIYKTMLDFWKRTL
ncbi:MAG TPA: S9 family peptidase [Blastocatellia bacterium]|nr:S9 family peptidase [Blastocatellia bacterium]